MIINIITIAQHSACHVSVMVGES